MVWANRSISEIIRSTSARCRSLPSGRSSFNSVRYRAYRRQRILQLMGQRSGQQTQYRQSARIPRRSAESLAAGAADHARSLRTDPRSAPLNSVVPPTNDHPISARPAANTRIWSRQSKGNIANNLSSRISRICSGSRAGQVDPAISIDGSQITHAIANVGSNQIQRFIPG